MTHPPTDPRWPRGQRRSRVSTPGRHHRPRSEGRAEGQSGILLIGILVAVVLLCSGGTVALIAMDTRNGDTPAKTSDGDRRSPGAAMPSSRAPTTSPASPPPSSPSPSASLVAKDETLSVVETQLIPFTETTVDDPTLPVGSRQLRTVGVDGVKSLTYAVVYTDGVETGRWLVAEAVAQEPVAQVTAVGTLAAPVIPPVTPAPPSSGCHPSYTPCVPVVSDVDCKGGGNGPVFVTGPIYIHGPDDYQLDGRDRDFVGCEPRRPRAGGLAVR